MAYSISDVGPAQYALQQQGMDEDRKRAMLNVLMDLAARKFQNEQAQFSRGMAEKEFAYKQGQDQIANALAEKNAQRQADATAALNKYYEAQTNYREQPKPVSPEDQMRQAFIDEYGPVKGYREYQAASRAPKEPKEPPVSMRTGTKQGVELRRIAKDLEKKKADAAKGIAALNKKKEEIATKARPKEDWTPNDDAMMNFLNAKIQTIQDRADSVDSALTDLASMEELPTETFKGTAKGARSRPGVVEYAGKVIDLFSPEAIEGYKKMYPGESVNSIIAKIKELIGAKK